MANDYFTNSGYPTFNANGDSASARAEFALVTSGFDKLPLLAGFALRLVRVNAAGTALESVTAATARLMASDGTSTATANIPLGGFKITGLAAATANGDAVRFEQVGTLAASLDANTEVIQLPAGAAAEVAAGRTNSVPRADGSWSSRVRRLPNDYALQTWGDDLALGAYDVLLSVPQNGLPSGWWYIEVMRHFYDTSTNQYRYLRATPLSATLAAQPVYHCSDVNGTWSAWTPVAARLQATTAQAQAGTNTTTDMSPARVKQAILALGGTSGMAGAAAELAAGRTNSVPRADGSWSARARYLPQDYALQTWADDLALGAYDVNLTVAQNGLPRGWWYIEVMRHSNDVVANQHRYLRATPLNAPLASQSVYHCSVVGGAWSAWTPVGDNPLTWYTPTFVNSWVDYTSIWSARYAKDLTNGIVYMKGLVRGGSNTITTTIFTLPVGMRPSSNIMLSQTTSFGAGRLDINTTGKVDWVGANLHTGNANGFLSISATFKAEL